MSSPRRGEQQAAPAERRVIRFSFCQQSCSVCAESKATITLAGHTHTPLPLNPVPTSVVRHPAVPLQEPGWGGMNMWEATGVLEEPLNTRVSGYKAGNKCPSTPLISAHLKSHGLTTEFWQYQSHASLVFPFPPAAGQYYLLSAIRAIKQV